jgi:hypothetical protein
VETNSFFAARFFCRIALITIVSGNTAFMTAHPNVIVYVFLIVIMKAEQAGCLHQLGNYNEANIAL